MTLSGSPCVIHADDSKCILQLKSRLFRGFNANTDEGGQHGSAEHQCLFVIVEGCATSGHKHDRLLWCYKRLSSTTQHALPPGPSSGKISGARVQGRVRCPQHFCMRMFGLALAEGTESGHVHQAVFPRQVTAANRT